MELLTITYSSMNNFKHLYVALKCTLKMQLIPDVDVSILLSLDTSMYRMSTFVTPSREKKI